ncbi:MAG: ImmA/IrrE family metallo-endopeptidase [Oligoflexales bacterium]
MDVGQVGENRYQNSAALFRFCKEALESRHQGQVKVIDQDVGAILGYDPADCSHWKRGKKNIKSLPTLRSIANHLKIDEKILIDLTAGRVELEEALFEYQGYGAFALNPHRYDQLKQDFFRSPEKWPHSEAVTCEQLLDVNRPEILSIIEKILSSANCTEAPVYIPEVYKIFQSIELHFVGEQVDPILIENNVVSCRSGVEDKAYGRFLLAKKLFYVLREIDHAYLKNLIKTSREIFDIQANIFATNLLVPGKLLRTEAERVLLDQDVVQQLAEVFWVSKGLMNRRFRDYMEHLS